MAKNIPQRERPALRSRSSYSNPERDGGVKIPYSYPEWVRSGKTPLTIENSLAAARRDPRKFKMVKPALTPTPDLEAAP